MEPILVATPKPVAAAQPSDRRKPCPFCGELIVESAIKCRFCSSMLVPVDGAIARSPSSPTTKLVYPSDPPKDPILMGLLSGCCIAPGLGQMVLGQVVKGVVFLIGAMALAVITLGTSILVTWPLMGVDAYMVARKLKSGSSVTEWESFPSG
jgi:TM2 domain-containing membrane protein YozV